MKIEQARDRQARTRHLIQLGGILAKSGLADIFEIHPNEDLQAHRSRFKAVRLAGFLNFCLEQQVRAKASLMTWQERGEKLLGSKNRQGR